MFTRSELEQQLVNQRFIINELFEIMCQRTPDHPMRVAYEQMLMKAYQVEISLSKQLDLIVR